MNVKFSRQARQAILALTVSSVLFTGVANAGLPVIDFGAIAQAITQVNNQIKQIENMRGQLKAITDNGNFADLLNDPKLRGQLNQYLPKGYRDITQLTGNTAALQSIYQQVLQDEANKRKTMTGAERVKMTSAMAEAQLIGMMKTLDTRSQSVQTLVNQINRTQNTAQKQDLMNTLQAEQAMINVDLNRMQVVMKMVERQEKMAEKQAADEYWKKKVSMK